MQRRGVFVVALAILMATQGTGLGDWKSHLARKAVGRAARDGMGDAVEHAAKDAAFDAALGAVPRAGYDVGNAVQRIGVGSTAGAGIESAMTAANVASSMDTALDAAEAAQKANKVRKAIKKVR